MNLIPVIEGAWNDVEQAHQRKHLVNQSIAGFILCKALMQKLPDLQVTYDGRTCRDYEARPNLFIWQDGTTPLVHFIGNLRYGLHEVTDGREQIQSLDNFASMSVIPVLTHNPVSLKYSERQMVISPELEFGFFNVDEWKIEYHCWSAHSEH